MVDKELIKNIDEIIRLEQENVDLNSKLLQNMMDRGVQNIDQLDEVADRLRDSMLGLTGKGEDEYRRYLDYLTTFNPVEAKERREQLEYDMGYKTHVLYAAAMLCKKELEGHNSPDGRSSFIVVMEDFVPKVCTIEKKVASFLFFAHYANGSSVSELMQMLHTLTEDTDSVLEHVEEFEDLMFYPNETYHPLREDEWQLMQTIVEHNIQQYEKYPELNKELLHRVFGRRKIE